MNKNLPNAFELPIEIVTDPFDKRQHTLAVAAASNNHLGFLDSLADQGFEWATSKEIRESALPAINESEWTERIKDPEIQKLRDDWYKNLYLKGLGKVFGHRALNRNTAVIKEERTDQLWAPPQVIYRGELPKVLGEHAVDAARVLQSTLDLKYGEHDVTLESPRNVLLIYEEDSVGLNARSRTVVQDDKEVWEIGVKTFLSGPIKVRFL